MIDLQVRLQQLREKARVLNAGPSSTPSLGERLERLRVATPARRPPSAEALAASLQAEVAAPGLIEISRTYPLPFRHGDVTIASAHALAEAARSLGGSATPVAPESLLYLDTETTGLAGGTGTVAFMVGLAWIEGGALRVVQWLLAGFAAEGALVARVSERLTRASVIVSFNGKSFDVPLLKARARLAGADLPTDGRVHLDLLHVTRRLLHSGWPDCRLRTAEARALRLDRTDDLPGAEAPAAWRRWLERGEASQLGRVADHNRADLLALVALLALLERPTAREAPLLHAPA
jgi:uncharacterized protein YprB with RNaseH-like and TPR domain